MSKRLLTAVEILTPLAVVGGLIVWTARAQQYLYPPLGDILIEFPHTWGVEHLASDVLPSLRRLGAGLAIATLVGIPAGLILGRYERPRAFLSPLMEFLRAIPAPVLLPVAVLIIGLGDDAKIAVIAEVCVWPILLNSIDGAAGLKLAFSETSAVFRVGPVRRFFRVVLPAALPQIFAGLRVAISLGLILVVVSEMVASQNGIGHVILVAQRTFSLAQMWSGIILLGILGYLFNLLFNVLERFVLAWHLGSRAQPE